MYRVKGVKDILPRMPKDGSVVLIGAGLEGRKQCLDCQNAGISPAALLDDDPKKQGWHCCGIPIMGVSAFHFTAKDCGFICIEAFRGLSDEEVMRKDVIAKTGLPADRLFLLDGRAFAEQALKRHMEEEDIKKDEAILRLRGVDIPNFLLWEEPVRSIFLTECGDLILPGVFHDDSAVGDGAYEDDTLGVQLDEDDVVFDCGANLGLFSAYAASKVNKVYAFEPVPKTYQIVQRVAALHNNIEACNFAISDKMGTARMTNLEALANNKLVDNMGNYGGDSVEVPCIALDDFVERNGIERVDFIKADIEGAESKMLLGAKNILQRFTPKLSICEYHLPDDPAVLERIIKDANPRYTVVHKEHKIFAYVKE